MILLIDNYDSFTYNLYQLLAGQGMQVEVVRNDAISIEEIGRITPQAIVLSPGPGRPSDAGICIDLIQAYSSSIPILGICLGHQAIGEAFGAKVASAGEIMHGKQTCLRHQQRGLFAGLPSPLTVGRYHSLAISKTTIPSCLEVHAETDEGIVMAVKHVRHPCYGLQFHPESILTPYGRQLMETFLDKEVARCSSQR